MLGAFRDLTRKLKPAATHRLLFKQVSNEKNSGGSQLRKLSMVVGGGTAAAAIFAGGVCGKVQLPTRVDLEGFLGKCWHMKEEPTYVSMEQRFEVWKHKYGVKYNDQTEEAKRYETFKENVQMIDELNKLGINSYAANRLADWTFEEFKKI